MRGIPDLSPEAVLASPQKAALPTERDRPRRESPRQRLFDPGPTGRHPITGRALVPLPRLRCPACGSDLTALTTWQPALFVACGYGAALQTDTRRCLACGWALTPETVEVNPRWFR